MENPIKMDDLGVPIFLETPIYWVCWEKKGSLDMAFLVGDVGKVQAGFARAW